MVDINRALMFRSVTEPLEKILDLDEELHPNAPERLLDQAEEVLEEAADAIEEVAREHAEASAAQAWSTPFDEDAFRGAWISAEFGNYAYAVNGHLVIDGSGEEVKIHEGIDMEAPKDYYRTNRGGDIPTTESYADRFAVVHEVSRRENLPPVLVEAVWDEVLQLGEEVPVSVSGYAEIWRPEEVRS